MSKKQIKNNIAVIGTGYVGLVTGACFAELGSEVVCLDNNREKINKLKKGIIPIFEPGLEVMVKKNTNEGRLSFDSDISRSLQDPKIIFICVGTPQDKGGRVDLSYIKNVAEEISKNIKKPKIIVTKSTIPVGTIRNLISKIIAKNWKGPFEVASNPEFLREGTAVNDFLNPDRIIIGVNSKKAGEALLALYKKIDCPKLVTTPENAEIIKYAANAFLATKISFINEIANICEKTNADVEEVARGLGMDKRIGEHFLRAGIGWGGSCFPKDVKGFYHLVKTNGYNFRLLKATIEANNYQKKRIIEKIKSLFPEEGIKNKTIGVLGLAFKGNTDDVRESVAIAMIKKLQKLGAKIKTYDPKAMENAKRELNRDIQFCHSPYETAANADLLVIATDWKDFSRIDWKKIKTIMKNPIIIDGRNILNPLKMEKIGFRYIGVGRNIKII